MRGNAQPKKPNRILTCQLNAIKWKGLERGIESYQLTFLNFNTQTKTRQICLQMREHCLKAGAG